MSNKLSISPQCERLRTLSLEHLFAQAETFGAVMIHGSRDVRPPDCYSCKISFDSIPGTNVEARSEFGRSLPDALIEAIDRATRIAEAYK